MNQVPIILAIVAGLAGAAAHAQTVYRCGNEYSTTPCVDAKALVLADAITAEQRAEARDVARREKLLAAEMTRDRREREAALKPALAGSLSGPGVAPAPHASAKKPLKKAKKNPAGDGDGDFIAAVPKPKKTGT